jgi:hypothetical protein
MNLCPVIDRHFKAGTKHRSCGFQAAEDVSTAKVAAHLVIPQKQILAPQVNPQNCIVAPLNYMQSHALWKTKENREVNLGLEVDQIFITDIVVTKS